MDYRDKDFQTTYEEVLENIKNLTTKIDFSVSDESDPGVVILKTFALFWDKLNYKINYRNAQNSVTDVTDMQEGERLFSSLGYQMKKKRSATGELSIKNISSTTDGGPIKIPLFTVFSNQSESIHYTSVRALVSIGPGLTKLVKVQEGMPVRYQYEGNDTFNTSHITNNLRLSLRGIEEVADNGVVICTIPDNEEIIASDWLNVGDGFFNSVETDNIFSIGRDIEGVPYIQFYEESLPSLQKGVAIWIISSSGAAGNISANKIARVIEGIDETSAASLAISNPEFTNGQDPENLASALKNYYETFGINNTLVSERDYKVAIEKEVDENLVPLVSKALVTGIDGKHNLVEIVSKLNNGKEVTLTQFVGTLLSVIFVCALKYSDDYYESFQILRDSETENLIRKAIFGKNIVSNDIKLAATGDNGDTIYDRFIFDIAKIAGTIIINSSDTASQIKEKVVAAIEKKFNSRNLTPGTMITEGEISQAVKESLPEVIDASFYYLDGGHTISKSPLSQGGDLAELSDDEKLDILARGILSGDIKLFEESNLFIPLLGGKLGVKYYPSVDGNGKVLDTSKRISKIIGTFASTMLDEGGKTTLSTPPISLTNNKILQLYRVALDDSQAYGVGVKYNLTSSKYTLSTDTDITDSINIKAQSRIAMGSILPDASKHGGVGVDTSQLGEGVYEESDKGEGLIEITKEDGYIVQVGIEYSGIAGTKLAEGTVLEDGSILNGNEVFGFSLKDGEEADLSEYPKVSLRLTPDGQSWINLSQSKIRVSGFGTKGLVPGEAYLTSSQQIITLEESQLRAVSDTGETSSVLGSEFYYALVINSENLSEDGKLVVDSNNGGEYLLSEGEHLIYSDKNLLDFIDFGSGTLIRPGDGKKVVLSNIQAFDGNIRNNLQKIPEPGIKILNTEVITISSGEAKFPGGIKIGPDWQRIPDGEKIIITGNSNGEYDSDYHHREILRLVTDTSNSIVVSGSTTDFEKLEITIEGEEETIVIGSKDNTKIVSFSEPIIISGSGYKVPESSRLSIATYNQVSNPFDGFNGIEIDGIPIEGEFTFTKEEELSSGTDSFLQFLPTEKSPYLVEIEVKLEGEGEIRIGSIGGIDTDSPSSLVSILGENKNLGTVAMGQEYKDSNGYGIRISSSGKYFLLVFPSATYPEENTQNSPKVKFDLTYCSGGSSVEVLSITKITGLIKYLPDLVLSDNNNGTEFKDNLGKKLLTKINKLISGGNRQVKFDFNYEPTSPLTSPMDPISFYDQDHPMNRNIITQLDLSGIKAEGADSTLRIIWRNR